MLPFSWAVGIGSAAGGILYLAFPARRELAVRQAMERLGLDERAARRLVRDNFRHYGKVTAELCRLGSIADAEYDRRTDYEGFVSLVRELLREGKGVVIITAHHGNWEWSNGWCVASGVTGGCIARPLDNPLLDRWLRAIRNRRGLAVVDKSGAIRAALKVLRRNGVMGILIDQDAGPNGRMSPFLGKPASTETLPVKLAARIGAPMVVVAAIRDKDSASTFTLRHDPEVVRARPDADPEEEAQRLTDELNDRLGRLVRETPEQWFWVHRRWKSQHGQT
jgi:KDO2-lipid IV(A) lauroyltransferase